jgi:protein YIPF1/2
METLSDILTNCYVVLAFLGTSSSPVPEDATKSSNNGRGYYMASAGPATPWTIEYYQPYFDVDTKTVLKRCAATLYPVNDFITHTLQSTPDLYGPFWTQTTVIFALFVFSSLASSVTSYMSDDKERWDYDFTLLSVAVGLVYSYGIAVPAALWLALKYLGVTDWGLTNALAIWGYGMTVWM